MNTNIILILQRSLYIAFVYIYRYIYNILLEHNIFRPLYMIMQNTYWHATGNEYMTIIFEYY